MITIIIQRKLFSDVLSYRLLPVQHDRLILQIPLEVVQDVFEGGPVAGIHLVRVAVLRSLLEKLDQECGVAVLGQVAEVLLPGVRVVEQGGVLDRTLVWF